MDTCFGSGCTNVGSVVIDGTTENFPNLVGAVVASAEAANVFLDVLTVTGGGTLAASDVAALRCAASTSEGNWLRSGLTAIQVASLNGG